MNYVVPTVSIFITQCEGWDYQSTKVKNEVWKQFLAIILNIVIIVAIAIEFLLRFAVYTSNPIMSSLPQYSCREDQVASMFFKLVCLLA